MKVSTDMRGTADEILTCDWCHGRITDQAAMIYWRSSVEMGAAASDLTVGHKRCDPCYRKGVSRYGDEGLPCSLEIAEWIEPTDALFQLARLVNAYEWSAADLRKMAIIAWAVQHVFEGQEPKFRFPREECVL